MRTVYMLFGEHPITYGHVFIEATESKEKARDFFDEARQKLTGGVVKILTNKTFRTAELFNDI